jgi:hypothetical protein
VLLTAAGELRLADFGTAIKQDVEVPFLPVGTPDFMAPEALANAPPRGAVESPVTTPTMLRLAGIAPYDEKVDVWAVGALAYELVVGRPPFYRASVAETRAAVAAGAPPPVPAALAGSPFEAFVRAALAADPRARPSAGELLHFPWIAGALMTAADVARSLALPGHAAATLEQDDEAEAAKAKRAAAASATARRSEEEVAALVVERVGRVAGRKKPGLSEAAAALVAAAMRVALEVEAEEGGAAPEDGLERRLRDGARHQRTGSWAAARRGMPPRCDSEPAHAAWELAELEALRARGDGALEPPTPAGAVPERRRAALLAPPRWARALYMAARQGAPARSMRRSESSASDCGGGSGTAGSSVSAEPAELPRAASSPAEKPEAGLASATAAAAELRHAVTCPAAPPRVHWLRSFSVRRGGA